MTEQREKFRNKKVATDHSAYLFLALLSLHGSLRLGQDLVDAVLGCCVLEVVRG